MKNSEFDINLHHVYLYECVIICLIQRQNKVISKQHYEAQLQQIFRLLLENKTQEEIARKLHISSRTVARYSQRVEKRYGHIQKQKTDNTLFLECQLFKNKMLSLYKSLEAIVTSDKTSGTEKAKCAEIA